MVAPKGGTQSYEGLLVSVDVIKNCWVKSSLLCQIAIDTVEEVQEDACNEDKEEIAFIEEQQLVVDLNKFLQRIDC